MPKCLFNSIATWWLWTTQLLDQVLCQRRQVVAIELEPTKLSHLMSISLFIFPLLKNWVLTSRKKFIKNKAYCKDINWPALTRFAWYLLRWLVNQCSTGTHQFRSVIEPNSQSKVCYSYRRKVMKIIYHYIGRLQVSVGHFHTLVNVLKSLQNAFNQNSAFFFRE